MGRSRSAGSCTSDTAPIESKTATPTTNAGRGAARSRSSRCSCTCAYLRRRHVEQPSLARREPRRGGALAHQVTAPPHPAKTYPPVLEGRVSAPVRSARASAPAATRRRACGAMMRFPDDRLGLRQEERNCEKEKCRLWCFDGSKSLPADSPGCLTTWETGFPCGPSGSAQSLGLSKDLSRTGRSEGCAPSVPRGSS